MTCTGFAGYCASAVCCENNPAPSRTATITRQNIRRSPQSRYVNCSRLVRLQPTNLVPPLEPPRKIEGECVEIVFNSQLFGSMDRPMWVVKKFTRKRDEIGLPGAEYLLCLPSLGNQSDCDGLNAGFSSHAFSIGNMIARNARHEFRVDR